MTGTLDVGLRLKECRAEQGLTQQAVAERLAALAWTHTGTHVGVNPDMISKWERGEKPPSRLYQQLFCLVFERTPSELGFRSSAGRTAPPAPTAERHGFEVTLLEAATILETLGPAGQLIRPKMIQIWKDDAVKRRSVLKLLGTAPAAVLFGDKPAGRGTTRRASAAAQDPAALDDLATQYHRLYHSAAPAALMTPVVAHLALVDEWMRDCPSAGLRRRLLRNRSWVGLLAGRLAFFDVHDGLSARGYFSLAAEAARAAEDHLLLAAALGHAAFIPAAEGSFGSGLDYLRGAVHHAEQRPHGPVLSWLHAVESELHANAGNQPDAQAAIRRAQARIDTGRSDPLPWFDYYDRPRLAGFAGYAYLRLGHHDQATRSLDDALRALPRQAVKQRSVFLADLATVHVQTGEIDEACRVAGQATDALAHAGYATGTDRLRNVRRLLAPWNRHPGVRTFDEQLALTAGGI
jgi:transcriptional regulator with XRE-family HTH domain